MRSIATVCLAGVLAGPLCAQTVLFDFETDVDLQPWHYENQPLGTAVKEIGRVERFATSGKASLCFSSPRWGEGMPQWPAFECQPPITDWSGFDRLVYDLTNATPHTQRVFLFISDSKIATRDGLLTPAMLQPSSHMRVVIPLETLKAKGVDLADIHVMHVFTESPPGDMAVYIDRMLLLKAGEEPGPVAPEYLKQFAAMVGDQLSPLRDQVRQSVERERERAKGMPQVEQWLDREAERLQRRVDEVAALQKAPDERILQVGAIRESVVGELERLRTMVGLRVGFEPIRSKVRVGAGAREDVCVGFATSMEKVLPRALDTELSLGTGTELALARNEKESFQVIVLPSEADLKDVSIQIDDLQGPEGALFPSASIDAVPVGYAETKAVPPYGASHVGWWPDPILDFMRSCDIQKGDAQAFWVRVRAPKDQAAGRYAGKLQLLAEGGPAFSFDLTVQVYDFTMPDASPLPLAITWWPMFYTADSHEGLYANKSWEKHKLQWGRFLADYYMSFDSLYAFANWSPDFEVLKAIHDEGRLGRFNLGYYGTCEEGQEEAFRAGTVAAIRPRYEKAKELGLLDHAYIYGCDENPAERFPGVERAVSILKQEFPDVTVLTTTYDNSFGQDSVIKSMDAFCPLTPSFDVEKAKVARANGKEVWWYICCGPRHPFANMFIEYGAIEGRLLMGAMTAKCRPDGFLYYETSIWNAEPITSGPFTDWDPRSWTTFHGDGSWTCPGPDGTPLATIRLENFRDGLEDYAYYRILEATIAAVRATGKQDAATQEWLAEAEVLLTVPEDLVSSLTQYTDDPRQVYSYRSALAEAIESAGVNAVDPWAGK